MNFYLYLWCLSSQVAVMHSEASLAWNWLVNGK